MKKNLLFFTVLFTLNVFGQIPEIIVQHCYSTNSDDFAHAICNTANGYMLGLEIHDGEGLPNYHSNYDILIISIDSTGEIIWEKCFGGQQRDLPNKIIKTDNDEYYIYGKTKSSDGDVQSGNYGGYDLWVVKINQQGDILWESNYGSADYDTPGDMILTTDGGFLLLAEIKGDGGDVSTFYGDIDIWLCKCDAEGNIEWEKTFGNEGKDLCQNLSVNNQGNILLAGSVEQQGGAIDCNLKGDKDIWVAEINLQGNILWQQCYGGSNIDLGYKIIDIAEGYILLASTQSEDGDVSGYHGIYLEGDDIWVAKIDYQGAILWQICLGGSHFENPAFIDQTDDGGFIVIGNTFSNNGNVSGNHFIYENSSDVWVVKLTSDGLLEWQQCFGGADNETLEQHGTVIKGYYNYVMAVSSGGSSGDISCAFTDNGAWMFEIEKCPGYGLGTPLMPSGPDTVWSGNHPEATFTIEPPANAWTFNWVLEPDTAGEITSYGLYAKVMWLPDFTGMASISAQSANYCGESNWSQAHNTFVYNTLGIDEIIENNLVVRVYPNPASDRLVFDYSLPDSGTSGIIKISDVTGKVIETFVVEGTQGQKIWDTRKVGHGVYFYNFNAFGVNKSGKIVVIK